MAYTDKQMRNGATGDSGTQNTAVSGPMPADVGGLMQQAESAAAATMAEGHALMESPQGSGVSGHEVGTHGSTYEWDSGLAINDVEGGMSG